jgi:hypothetical protein
MASRAIDLSFGTPSKETEFYGSGPQMHRNRKRNSKWQIDSDTGYFAEVPLEAILSRMAIDFPTHIASKPNQGRNEFCAAASGAVMADADAAFKATRRHHRRSLAAQRRPPRKDRWKGPD